MEEFKKYIKQTDDVSNIIHINYNLPKFEKIKTYDTLVTYVENNFKNDMNNYLLIDEIQMCDDFEKAINDFHAEEKYQYEGIEIVDIANWLSEK